MAYSSRRPGRQLRRSGKGQKPNKALGLTTTQIQQLWDAKQLGDHSPKSLLRTVWFLNTIHFGWRARDEHRHAKLGDFQIKPTHATTHPPRARTHADARAHSLTHMRQGGGRE